ncbi:MAG: glutathione S-transferase family protein [Alphaproteobacteria bacterium]|nr:glutathione S-transferase family protein [Alphaproteobacteria bacterium]
MSSFTQFKKATFAASSALLLLISTVTPTMAEISTPSTQPASAARTIYGSQMSPFVLKVIIAMAEKNLDFKLVETLPKKILHAKGSAMLIPFDNASPLGKIPAYREGEYGQEDSWTIADSAVIIAYLDKNNPEHPLYPTNAKKFAETLWYEKYGDEVMANIIHHKILFEQKIKPVLFKKPTDEKILKDAIMELPPLFDYLDGKLKGKKWIVGDDFTAADIAIGVQLLSLKKCNISIDEKKWPNLVRYSKDLFQRDAFKKNIK